MHFCALTRAHVHACTCKCIFVCLRLNQLARVRQLAQTYQRPKFSTGNKVEMVVAPFGVIASLDRLSVPTAEGTRDLARVMNWGNLVLKCLRDPDPLVHLLRDATYDQTVLEDLDRAHDLMLSLIHI